MKRRAMAALLLGALHLAPTPRAEACTAICLSSDRQVVVAKGYDFHVGHGLLVQNRRGVVKEALVLGRVKPARWESLYASVTFNQYGRELPLGGMNEKGLVVEILWLNGTRHPALVPGRETVNELQLIQYLLDRAANLGEALAAVRRLQVARVHADVHYFLCDRGGACATVEHLDGKLVIHSGASLPVRALTNDAYAASVRHRAATLRKAGKRALPKDRSSLSRFLRAAQAASAQDRGAGLVARAFAALDDVRQGTYTQWQIVYEPGAGRVHFRSPGSREPAVALILDARSCDVPVTVMDLLGTVGGRALALVPYRPALNRSLVQKSFAQLGARLPAEVIAQVARYPELTTCRAPGAKPAETEVLAALGAYRRALVARDVRALKAMVHPRYHDEAGTPSPADDVNYAALVAALDRTVGGLISVRYAIYGPRVRFDAPDLAVVEARIEASYEIAPGRVRRHADRNRFVLRRHQGKWLFVRGL